MKLYGNMWRRVPTHNYTRAQKIARAKELARKMFIMLGLPLVSAELVSAFWYYTFYSYNIHFGPSMENVVCAAWIPTFGILYSLMAAAIFNTVWSEYKAMRTAVKNYDIETFVNLRDEEMSPLVGAMMFILSGSVLLTFMSLKYPSETSGITVVGTTAYLFSLVYFVIKEVDDPCGGIWYIKSIPKEWLKIDPRKWRVKRQNEARRKYKKSSKETASTSRKS